MSDAAAHAQRECSGALLAHTRGARRAVEEDILRRMLAQGLPERQARVLIGLPPAGTTGGGGAADRKSCRAPAV